MNKQKIVIYGVIILAGLSLAWWINGNKGSVSKPSASNTLNVQRTDTRMSSSPPSNPGQARPGEILIGQLGVIVPDDWQAEPQSNTMRIAQFRLPAIDGTDVELAVTFNIGGGVKANVDRWYHQFQDPVGRDTTYVSDNLQITLVDIRGTFLGMRVEFELGNYQMLAAIVEAPDGPYFFKMTGPKESVSSLSHSFASFIGTIRYVGNQ